MSDITEALREEHRALLPHVDELRAMADGLDEMPPQDVRLALDGAYQFLTRHLIPHAAAEEEALYPAVGKILGSPQATATMSRDHVEVSRLTEELGRLHSAGSTFDLEQIKSLRRLLYGLHTLLKVHFAKEEEIYLPLLERHLSDAEAHRLLHKMAQLAHGEHDPSR